MMKHDYLVRQIVKLIEDMEFPTQTEILKQVMEEIMGEENVLPTLSEDMEKEVDKLRLLRRDALFQLLKLTSSDKASNAERAKYYRVTNKIDSLSLQLYQITRKKIYIPLTKGYIRRK